MSDTVIVIQSVAETITTVETDAVEGLVPAPVVIVDISAGPQGSQGIQGIPGPEGEEASEEKIPFSWGDATPAILAELAAGETIYAINLVILEPFDGDGAVLSIGVLGDPDLFMAANECDPKTVGVYAVTPGYLLAIAGTLRLFIIPGAGATKGNGVVMIDY